MRNRRQVMEGEDIAEPRNQLKKDIEPLFRTRRAVLKMLLGGIATGALHCLEQRATAAESGPFALTPLVIRTPTESHLFQVELAETADQRMQGLQGRRTLDPQAGMLFVFDSEAIATMWMKNTLIPLDMLFVSSNGRIVGIATNTKPFSLRPLSSPGPVKAVLELNAGTAERLGITPGDRVLHPAFTVPAD